MKPCLCLTLIVIGLALVCLLLSLTQPGLNHSLQVATSDHGRIEEQNPRPRPPPFRLSEARNSIRLSLDLSKFLFSTARGPPAILVQPASKPMGHLELIGPWRVVGQGGSSNRHHRAIFSPKLRVFSRRIEKSGFCNTL
jgi:hypothetical protein